MKISSKEVPIATTGGKIGSSIFLFIFFAFGAVFAFFMLRELYRGMITYTWDETPCRIISSNIENLRPEDADNYVLNVTYSYKKGEKEYQSETFYPGYNGSSDYSKVSLSAKKYYPQLQTFCYINPGNPSEAVLIRKIRWPFFAGLLIPLIFMLIGGGGIFFIWKNAGQKHVLEESISEKIEGGKGKQAGLIFFIIFLLISTIIFYFLGIRPFLRILDAKDWLECPCEIISSEVKSHSDNDGTTYSVEIVYSYNLYGEEHRSNRYNFLGGSSSGYSGKQKIVTHYKPGTNTICYVNPRNPAIAVLNRGFTMEMLVALVPLAFVLIGIGGIFYLIRSKAKERKARIRNVYDVKNPVEGVPSAGRVELKPKSSPVKNLIIVIFLALFWNGIVSIFVYQVVQDKHDWLFALFLIPFVLIGIALICGVFYCFLTLFNPRPKLILSSGAAHPGERVNLKWEFTGHTESIRKLNISLEGYEESKYRRGTSTYTDKSVFERVIIMDTDDSMKIPCGQSAFTVPPGTMHTFEASNNKIIWVLKINGVISFWPDIKQEFPFTVLPLNPQTLI